MNKSYDDMMTLSYPRPTNRRRMTMAERAAQFSPFAALTGYDAAIAETGRLTDTQVELASDGQIMLNEKLCLLKDCLEENLEILVTYFVPDERKSGGAYQQTTGVARKLDSVRKILVMNNGQEIPFERIWDIQGSFIP